MLTKRAATLKDTLGLKEIPLNGQGWHELILTGLPYSSLKATAKELGIKEVELAVYLGLKGAQLGARKRSKRLTAAESDVLYAIALAYVQLAGFKGTAGAKAWLFANVPELKNIPPMEWLRTRIGNDYVNVAITRMRPPMTFKKAVEEEDEDEAEDSVE